MRLSQHQMLRLLLHEVVGVQASQPSAISCQGHGVCIIKSIF